MEKMEDIDVEEVETKGCDDFDKLYVDDLGAEGIPDWPDLGSELSVVVLVSHSALDVPIPSCEGSVVERVESVPGLRDVPDPSLLDANLGQEKQASEQNDRWALRQADQLQSAMGWDGMSAFR